MGGGHLEILDGGCHPSSHKIQSYPNTYLCAKFGAFIRICTIFRLAPLLFPSPSIKGHDHTTEVLIPPLNHTRTLLGHI
jgi:hypothetical protein